MSEPISDEFLYKLRVLIQAEVQAGIAGNQEDESGYTGNNYAEGKIADEIFHELLAIRRRK